MHSSPLVASDDWCRDQPADYRKPKDQIFHVGRFGHSCREIGAAPVIVMPSLREQIRPPHVVNDPLVSDPGTRRLYSVAAS